MNKYDVPINATVRISTNYKRELVPCHRVNHLAIAWVKDQLTVFHMGSGLAIIYAGHGKSFRQVQNAARKLDPLFNDMPPVDENEDSVLDQSAEYIAWARQVSPVIFETANKLGDYRCVGKMAKLRKFYRENGMSDGRKRAAAPEPPTTDERSKGELT